MTTPISRVVNGNNHARATSLLTTLHAASSASAAAMPRAFNCFSFSLDDNASDDGPSLQKDLSNFSRKNPMMTQLHPVMIQLIEKRRMIK
jgi:hypothetical protein